MLRRNRWPSAWSRMFSVCDQRTRDDRSSPYIGCCPIRSGRVVLLGCQRRAAPPAYTVYDHEQPIHALKWMLAEKASSVSSLTINLLLMTADEQVQRIYSLRLWALFTCAFVS